MNGGFTKKWQKVTGGRGCSPKSDVNHSKFFYVHFSVTQFSTAYNTEISHNFLLWKFYGKAQFPHRPKLYANCAFPQSFHTRILGEVSLFYLVLAPLYLVTLWSYYVDQQWKYIEEPIEACDIAYYHIQNMVPTFW